MLPITAYDYIYGGCKYPPPMRRTFSQVSIENDFNHRKLPNCAIASF
ncbi:hypothetical protein Patl1_12287 [Pistacia atlantica]|uniref:Uncharacterized protein n=1 Tax=Pistacia atlantica TaxID=434234 RepID=A0ACC1A480_9ROSI|nr:hypothetical protein Patl1_12287 [Pistacia atlantica]